MIRILIAALCAFGMFGSGCSGLMAWGGPRVEPLVDGGGAVESGMYRGMPFVMASINGSEPMKFLFDTGANLNMLFTSSADELNIKPTSTVTVIGASGIRKKLPMAFVDELVFGSVSMGNMAFLIHDIQNSKHLSEPEGNEANPQIAGIIGIRGLEEFTIDINYPERRVSITDERLSLENPGTSEMRVRSDGLFMVPVPFSDPDEPGAFNTVWSLLDSGNIRFFDLKTNEAERYLDPAQRTSGHKATGVHGVEQLVDAGPLQAGILVGTTQLDGMIAMVSAVENRLDSSTLQNFHVKIDKKSRLVSFTRPDNAQRLVSTNRMGITHLWTFDSFRIDQTLEGSAAYLLGIRAFDEVLLIDGVEPNLMHLKTNYWAVEPGAMTITVRIRRVSDDGWVDVVLPIDGSIEGIEEQERINHKTGVDVQMTGEDGKVTRGVFTPIETSEVE